METNAYANPGALVSAEWLVDHLNAPNIRVIEAVWGNDSYNSAHIPGALAWEFVDDLGGTTAQPDLASQSQIEALLARSGISNGTTVVIYSGISNLLATFAYWVLKLYGHSDVRLLDGGRDKWIDGGYPVRSGDEVHAPGTYTATPMNWDYRADKGIVLKAVQSGQVTILDARPVEHYRGEDNSGTARAGHIPGAVNIPSTAELHADGSWKRWATAYTKADGTFRSRDELEALVGGAGIVKDKEIITYCVRGGLSTEAWFVLTQLLGYSNVREYERSWEEWGNAVDLPIDC